jgi:hypothetical protein
MVKDLCSRGGESRADQFKIQNSRFKIPKNFNSTPNIQNPKIALKQNYGKQYLTPNT